MKILLVEDEKMLGESISTYLKQEGYLCEWVKTFFSGDEKATMYQYDCALLDIGLPDGNGLDIVRALKKVQPTTGIIIISAKNSLDDRVSGLDLGADDYITKPFHLVEMNSRIRSLLRRRNFGGSEVVEIGNMKISPERHEVLVKNENVQLTKKEFALLLFFVTNKNRVLTKEALAEHLWGEEADMMDNFDFLYSHIKNMRKKLVTSGADDCIKSVYGMGYKFSSE